MKICCLGESTSIHDFGLIKTLVKKGYDTHVVTFTPEPVKIDGIKYYSGGIIAKRIDDARQQTVSEFGIYQQRKRRG